MRLRFRLLMLLILLAPAVGCTSFDVVQPPSRNADLYPHAEHKQDVWMAVDDIVNPKRVERFFGADLTELGITPVQLIVSNQGDERVTVGPADVLMLRGNDVIDPLPIQQVSALIQDRGGVVTDDTEEALDAFLGDLLLRETVLAPGQNYQGVLFFDTSEHETKSAKRFRVFGMYAEPVARLRVAITQLDSDRRIKFGPFGIYR